MSDSPTVCAFVEVMPEGGASADDACREVTAALDANPGGAPPILCMPLLSREQMIAVERDVAARYGIALND